MAYAAETREFVQYVVAAAAKAGVVCSLIPVPELRIGNVPTGGYFSPVQKVLVVATGLRWEDWVGTLAHEFSHLRQWANDARVYLESDIDDEMDYCRLVDMWIGGYFEFTDAQADDCFRRVRNLELDCVRRSVRLLSAWDLGIDLSRFILTENAYIYSHTVAQYERTWVCPGALSSHLRGLRRVCPDELRPARWYASTRGEEQRALYNYLASRCMAPVGA